MQIVISSSLYLSVSVGITIAFFADYTLCKSDPSVSLPPTPPHDTHIMMYSY